MRSAFITFPNTSNDGVSYSNPTNPLGNVKARLERHLGKVFGGYTAIAAQGFWRDAETGNEYPESVTVYEIAADWTDDMESNLRAIAARYAALGEQVCVMVKLANGESELVAKDGGLASFLAESRALMALSA